MAFTLFQRDAITYNGETPLAGKVLSALLSMLTIVVLSICFTRRINATANWSKIPLSRWITFAVYVDSIVFIIASTILGQGFGLNSTQHVCSAAILLCLTCYLTTKALIFFFLIEKVYIIQSVRKPRVQSKLYLFNCFFLLLPYCAIIVLNFVYRVAVFDESGICIIGMESKAVMPLIIMDALINFYLTLLFVIPLQKLYTYKQSPNSALRTIALRSFIGSCATLTSSVVNLTVLMVLKGEAAWICLMCCTSDILFSVVVLHWVTATDSFSTSSNRSHSIGTAPPGSSPPKSSSFHLFSSGKNQHQPQRSIDMANGTVTTDIFAMNKNRSSDYDTTGEIEMGKIRVHVKQLIEREGSETSADIGEEAAPRRSHLSTEDLVGRS